MIVTNNLSDFVPLPSGLEAQSPDEFLTNLFDLVPYEMVGLLVQQAEDMKRPPRTFDQLLDGLAKSVPGFVRAVRAAMED